MGATTTRGTRSWGALAGTLALALGLAVACDDGGTSPNGEDPGDAMIVATVTADGSAEQGVTLDLYEEGGTTSLETATTDMAGEAEFTMLDAGTYDVEVTVPSGLALASGESARKSVTVAESGQGTVSFELVAATDGAVVEINLTSSLTFSPDSVNITPGTTVRWINDASIFHTITPDGHSEWSRQEMSTAGQTFEHTFDSSGVFPYYCEPHRDQGMTGTIVVESSS